MTIQEVRDRLDEIRACADDDEAAHGLEDQLRGDVLRAIALGELRDVEAIQAAALALTSAEIKFARWCA